MRGEHKTLAHPAKKCGKNEHARQNRPVLSPLQKNEGRISLCYKYGKNGARKTKLTSNIEKEPESKEFQETPKGR